MSKEQRWWEERLRERHPLGCPATRIEGYNFKNRDGQDSWPKSVARISLYDDYRFWVQDCCVGEGPLSNLHFFVTIAPWVYYDKSRQVKNMWVKQPQQFEGRWTLVKVRRYMVRLATWEEHMGMYEQSTGVKMEKPLEAYDPT